MAECMVFYFSKYRNQMKILGQCNNTEGFNIPEGRCHKMAFASLLILVLFKMGYPNLNPRRFYYIKMADSIKFYSIKFNNISTNQYSVYIEGYLYHINIILA